MGFEYSRPIFAARKANLIRPCAFLGWVRVNGVDVVKDSLKLRFAELRSGWGFLVRLVKGQATHFLIVLIGSGLLDVERLIVYVRSHQLRWHVFAVLRRDDRTLSGVQLWASQKLVVLVHSKVFLKCNWYKPALRALFILVWIFIFLQRLVLLQGALNLILLTFELRSFHLRDDCRVEGWLIGLNEHLVLWIRGKRFGLAYRKAVELWRTIVKLIIAMVTAVFDASICDCPLSNLLGRQDLLLEDVLLDVGQDLG